MEWGALTTVALAMSTASLFVRWRFPSVPNFIASAGIGASLSIAILSWFHPSVELAFSIAGNVAFALGITDYLVSRPLRRTSGEALQSVLTLKFKDNSPPQEVSNQNIHSWYATTLMLTAVSEEGQKQRHTMTTWIIPLWFNSPTSNYQTTIESLSGEAIAANIPWRSELGMLVVLEAPDMPSVVQIRADQRQLPRHK